VVVRILLHNKFLVALSCLVLILSANAALASDKEATAPAPNIAPCMSWKNPLIRPKFAILCIHGLGLYSKSYENFAQRLARQGAIVYAIDVRGFGSWMQAKGHEEVNFDACLADVNAALQSIRQANPGMPVFLLGESMGGAIALRATSIFPELIDGLISSVPAADRFQTKRTDLKVALGILRGPRREINIGKQIVDQATTAKRIEDGKIVKVVNEELAQDWQSDPLARMELSPKELIQFQSFMNDNHDAVKKITSVPVLFVQGLDDNLVKPEGTWELVQAIRTPDRMMVALPSRHLVFEEMQSADPRIARSGTQLVLSWVAMHMPGMDDTDPANFGSNAADNTSLNGSRQVGQLGMLRMQALHQGQGPPLQSPATVPAMAPTAPAPQLTGGRPTILAFYANWAEQCASVDQLVGRCRTTFGDKVNCVKLNVNDTNSQELVKQFNVGTIPTVVFLNANGSVSSTLIGETQFANIAKGLAGILGISPASMTAGRPRPGLKRRAQLRAVGK